MSTLALWHRLLVEELNTLTDAQLVELLGELGQIRCVHVSGCGRPVKPGEPCPCGRCR